MTLLSGLAQPPPDLLAGLTSLGSAGVMGAMWLWERRTSRQREQQIDEAHARIVADKVGMDELIDVVRLNAEAMSRLTATHEQLLRQMAGRGTP
ncbi:MAG TPA: hypothetical protein VK324_00105 [Tepidisphaeraceae bacterium]|nr:hypothetical protein [Tepidisphaeraceae bacterium]